MHGKFIHDTPCQVMLIFSVLATTNDRLTQTTEKFYTKGERSGERIMIGKSHLKNRLLCR